MGKKPTDGVISRLAAAAGMTMGELAAKFSIPYRTIQDWNSGARKAPEYTLNLMEDALGVGVRYKVQVHWTSNGSNVFSTLQTQKRTEADALSCAVDHYKPESEKHEDFEIVGAEPYTVKKAFEPTAEQVAKIKHVHSMVRHVHHSVDAAEWVEYHLNRETEIMTLFVRYHPVFDMVRTSGTRAVSPQDEFEKMLFNRLAVHDYAERYSLLKDVLAPIIGDDWAVEWAAKVTRNHSYEMCRNCEKALSEDAYTLPNAAVNISDSRRGLTWYICSRHFDLISVDVDDSGEIAAHKIDL